MEEGNKYNCQTDAPSNAAFLHVPRVVSVDLIEWWHREAISMKTVIDGTICILVIYIMYIKEIFK